MNYIKVLSILIPTLFTFNNVYVKLKVEASVERILGGLLVEPRQIKYLVGIYRDGNYICGGGIIDEKFILTAAHCLINRTNNDFSQGNFKIIAGSDNLSIKTPSAVVVDVKTLYVPTVYNTSLWQGGYPKGDVAILQLKTGLKLGNNTNLQQLELPSADLSIDDVYKKFPACIAGFGRDNFTYVKNYLSGKQKIKFTSTRKLLKAKVEILDHKVCEKSYSLKIWNSTLCGRIRNYLNQTPQGICEGDSGGPLTQNGTTVIGVISASAYHCTKVASFKGFIENVKQGKHSIADGVRVKKL